MRNTGVVEGFNEAKGFRSLPEGARVELDVIQGPRGLQAANITWV